METLLTLATPDADAIPSQVCANCGTTSTPLWRKEGGINMCNACGIYCECGGTQPGMRGAVQALTSCFSGPSRASLGGLPQSLELQPCWY